MNEVIEDHKNSKGLVFYIGMAVISFAVILIIGLFALVLFLPHP